MTTALDLTTRNAVQQATFVRMVVIEAGLPVIVRVSSHDVPFSITESDGVSYEYPAVGSLLNVTEIISDIKSTLADVTVTLSGIGNNYISDIIDNPIKGNPVEIRRAFFNADTGAFLNISGNPVLEFSGIVNNYNVDIGDGTMSETCTVSLVCSSIMSVLGKKITGRRTNQDEQDYWFPGDKSMDRVAVIAEANFDFGGTTPAAAPQASPAITMSKLITG